MSFLNKILFKKQQKAEGTDCSFVFKIPSEDGNSSEEKLVVAHKMILGAVSPYFEANFKTEWEKNQPIPITTIDYDVFVKLLEIVYLNAVTLTTLDEGVNLFEAAHFYQMTDVLDLLRDPITDCWISMGTIKIAKMLNTAYKLQDWILLQVFTMAFQSNIRQILPQEKQPDPDWFNYHPDVINYLFSSSNACSAISETKLKSVLEAFVAHHNGTFSMEVFEPSLKSKQFHANRTITSKSMQKEPISCYWD